DGTESYEMTRAELGASLPLYKLVHEARGLSDDVPLRFEVDIQQAQRALRRLAERINRRAEPVSLDVEDGKAVLHGGDGVELAVGGSAWRVKEALEAQPPRSQVELDVQRTPSGEDGQSEATLRQFRYLLASFSTLYDASLRGRTHNLRIAARNVNGAIIPAGEVFSTNRTIGPRNAADGWREAKMFVSGQVVSGVGAGICQCASTLYNAALLAGLPIVERHPHMFRVPYVPASRDATIYWGGKDMRFRNSTNGPIYVQTFLRGGRFHARLYGTEPVRDNIKVESRTISRRRGTVSEAYRVVHTGSGVQRIRLSRDYYMPHP
ncbi:MAG: VanW family protein, partial [Armatimonadota bacterium]|nr:VanW family protein [Armatimonadota bacterium]